MSDYDCTEDVLSHIEIVKTKLAKFALQLYLRGIIHDESKLQEPEKSMFDEWTPKLKVLEFGSDEYKDALSHMGEALKHHYENNRHHPEHFQFGIDDMNLFDVVEMFCDWVAAAEKQGKPVDIDYPRKRFSMSDQLYNIFKNTIPIMSNEQEN
jgi:hypothetical protein